MRGTTHLSGYDTIGKQPFFKETDTMQLMMRLLSAPTSPYVRKVMVSAHLLGLSEGIELLPGAASPIQRDTRIAEHNPLAKMPTLILPNGDALYDSRVICEYLDSLRPEYGLFPASGPSRWKALTLQALGDGLLDAALLARYERIARRPEKQCEDWRAAQLVKVHACLDAIEVQADALATDRLTIGEVTLGCALGYLDFRFAELNWRDMHPKTAQWNSNVQALPAMHATIPFAL
jgi:glutathione S-transferase